jgi:flavodoxin I
MEISIIYTSKTGNTKEVAELIEEELKAQGHETTSVNIYNEPWNDHFVQRKQLIFFGSYTWGNGQLPEEMRRCLCSIIKEKRISLPDVAVFGTGEQMWPHYCRAVDEMAFHLSKITNVLGTLKIEQSPRGSQKHLPRLFVHQTLQEVERFVVNKS